MTSMGDSMQRENFVSRNLFRMALLLLTDLTNSLVLVKSKATRRRTMRTFSCKMIAVIFIFALNISLCFAGEVPPDIRMAAGEGINIFLKDPRLKNLHQLGIESQSDIDYAALGHAFQIFVVPTEILLNESSPQDVQSLAIPTNVWQFLILHGNKANVLLTVDIVDGKWTPVAIGSSGLAKELNKILEAWPASSGYQYRLFRVYQAKAVFVEISQGDKVIGIVPLTSMNVAIGAPEKEFDPTDLRDAKEMLINLRPTVWRNTQSGQ